MQLGVSGFWSLAMPVCVRCCWSMYLCCQALETFVTARSGGVQVIPAADKRRFSKLMADTFPATYGYDELGTEAVKEEVQSDTDSAGNAAPAVRGTVRRVDDLRPPPNQDRGLPIADAASSIADQELPTARRERSPPVVRRTRAPSSSEAHPMGPIEQALAGVTMLQVYAPVIYSMN